MEKIIEPGVECTVAVYQGKRILPNNLTPAQKIHELRFEIFMERNSSRIKIIKKAVEKPVKSPTDLKKKT